VEFLPVPGVLGWLGDDKGHLFSPVNRDRVRPVPGRKEKHGGLAKTLSRDLHFNLIAGGRDYYQEVWR